jgi:outer membrane lipoprotein-sorting protein
MLSGRHPLIVGLALLLLVAGCVGPLAGPSTDTLETRLSQGPAAETVRGTYTVTETAGDGTTRASGRVWKVPGRAARQVVRSPSRPTRVVVANASRTWVHFPARGEAYRRGYTILDQTGVQPYSYAALIGNLDAYRLRYRGTATVAGRSTHHVELTPAPDGGRLPELELYTYHVGAEPSDRTVRPTSVDLWLDTEHWYPLKHRLRVERDGGAEFTATVEYETVTFDESIDPDRFAFDPEGDVDVVLDDVAITYRPFDTVAETEARAGVVYSLPPRVGAHRLERTAVVQSAAGRAIKALYLPSGTAARETETRITRPTHPDAVSVVVSPDATYRTMTGLPPLDGETRTVAGRSVEFAGVDGHGTTAVFTCGDTRYTVIGQDNVPAETVRRFVAAATCR